MNVIQDMTVWIIMSTDRELIAKGTPRNRELIKVADKTDKKRILTYGTKTKAELGFKTSGFYGQRSGLKREDYLEAVQVQMQMIEIE